MIRRTMRQAKRWAFSAGLFVGCLPICFLVVLTWPLAWFLFRVTLNYLLTGDSGLH